MGSSTASETTINTSTDSANTMLTMVTITDGEQQLEETFDLVEIPFDKSSPTEPPTTTSPNSSISATSTAIPLVPASPTAPSTPSSPSPPPPSPPLQPLPPPPSSPKNKASRRSSRSKSAESIEISATLGIDGRSPADSPKHLDGKNRGRSPSSTSTSQGRYYGGGRTPPLPDLRATEFFSTPVRGSVDAGQPDADLEQSLLKLATAEDSLSGGNASGNSRSGSGQPPVNRQKNSSTKKHSQTKPSVNVTTNPLDMSLVENRTSSGRSREHHSSGRSRPRGKAAGGTPAGTKRTAQATIVVQQPSLSLDGPAATILLHPDGDVRNREENMRQLLDVANTLTLQEIHDFEMRYGSPHHNRSQSVKTPGSRSSGRLNYLGLPQQRARVASMPNTGVEEEYYRLRHFSITGKVVVNRGDSLKSRRSRSNNSVASSNSSTEFLTASNPGSARNSAGSLASSRESNPSQGSAPYSVLMLGAPAVGKSTLVSQFMTSEYLHANDTSIDDESGEKSVCVLLAGEESELTFIDHSCADMSPETCMTAYDPHAYCVVYSTTDPGSLTVAKNLLHTLWCTDRISDRAVILVGNKVDLVRCRTVSTEEGKSMATTFDCKFIETSVMINHNVDELLVGLLTQIRLKLENPERARDIFRKRSQKNRSKSPMGWCSENNSPKKYRGRRLSASLKVRTLLDRVWARDSKSKSCENLHVL